MKKILLFAVVSLCSIVSLRSQDIVNVKVINPSGSSNPHDLIISNDKLFFIAMDASNYNSLWVTLGTGATTTDIGPFGGVSNSIQELQNYNNKIYFSYSDGVNGQEPWVSDGTTGGTVMLADIYPGSTGSNPKNFTVANNTLFFLANNTNGAQRLYASDGTVGNAIVVKDNIVNGFNGERGMAVLNNYVYFEGDDGSGSGYGLWKSDGTVAGTTLVKGGIIVANFNGNSPVLNGKMYLNVNDNINGDELWVTDGTGAGTSLVKDIYPGGSGEPMNFQLYHNKIYFSARDGVNGEELWVTDGSGAGTQMVKDVVAGSGGSQPRAITVYKDSLFFITWATQELWKTDGTDVNTLLVKSSIPSSIFSAVWNSTLYMISGSDFSTYQSNGTTAGTIPMRADNTTFPISHYSQFGSDNYFLSYHNELYLQALVSGFSPGYELYKFTGAAALPLRLLSFTGQAAGGNDELSWTADHEINTAAFLIEQSTDGNVFTAIGEVKAVQNYSLINQYSFTHRSGPGGTVFYRLKMVDRDNAYTYSPVIAVKHADAGALKIIYQRANRSVVISNPSNTSCSWQLYAADGVLRNRGISSAGVLHIPLYNLNSGAYIIVCSARNATQSLTFIVN